MHFHFVTKSSEISEFEILNIRQYFNFRQCVILTSLIKKETTILVTQNTNFGPENIYFIEILRYTRVF